MIIQIILFLSVVLVLIGSYVNWRIIGALGLVTNWNQLYIKWTIISIFLYLLIYPLLALLGGLLGSQRLISAIREGDKFIDYFFMYPFWLGLVFVLQLGILLFCIDVIKFLFFLIYKSEVNQWRIAHAWIVITLTTMTGAYVAVKVYLDTTTVKTTGVKIKVPNLPDSLEGFKIVHISDLQADSQTVESRIEEYINKANRLRPDIVVFTGDVITYGTEYIEKGTEMIGKLKAKYGVYACLGDHDYWSDTSLIIRRLRENGVKIFKDENYILDVSSAKIYMTFVTNIYSKRPTGEVLKTLASQNVESSLKIFISHQPTNELVKFAADNSYDIFLAGHTHGGQVVFSLFGIKLTPVLFETNYLSGPYKFNSMFINTNNGLGLTFAPIRYNAPASVTVIELEKGG